MGGGGGGGRPAPPPELKFPSSRRDQQKFILGLSFLWKFQPDWPTLRGGLIWSGILWYSRYLHSLNLYYGLDMYFWENTPPKFTLVGTPVAENMVSSLRFALIEKIPAYPDAAPRGYIHGFLEPISHKWHHWYSWCNPKTYAIRFSMCQVIFKHGYRPLVISARWFEADLHVLQAWNWDYQQKLIWPSTEFPVKISARLTNFKRWFDLIWHSMILSLPALPESVLWAGYVLLRKYTTQIHFSGDSCGRKYGFQP